MIGVTQSYLLEVHLTMRTVKNKVRQIDIISV